MANPDDRGTTMDPKWDPKNLTGGNDSGASGITGSTDGIDKADGPDRTARMLEEDGSHLPGHGPETAAPGRLFPHEPFGRHSGQGSEAGEDDDSVTDESGRIASSAEPSEWDYEGPARDRSVSG